MSEKNEESKGIEGVIKELELATSSKKMCSSIECQQTPKTFFYIEAQHVNYHIEKAIEILKKYKEEKKEYI